LLYTIIKTKNALETQTYNFARLVKNS